MRIINVEDLLKENNKLASENIALKKHINDIRIQTTAKKVASQIDAWLDEPYQDGKTKTQDINDFALVITKYIDYRLRD